MHRLVSELKPVPDVTLVVEPEGDVGAAYSRQGDPGGLDVPVTVVKVGRDLLAEVRVEHVQHILGGLRLVCVDIRRAAIAVLSHDYLLSPVVVVGGVDQVDQEVKLLPSQVPQVLEALCGPSVTFDVTGVVLKPEDR